MSGKRALILSPFATTPADAGQRKRVRQVTEFFKREGYEITFLFYAFEEGWMARANEDWLAQMRRDWGEVILWRAGNKVGLPPANGQEHALDEWWDDSLEALLRQLFAYRYFDVFVVNNVWLSKAMDLAPRGTIRVLDTHDIFSARKACFRRLGIAPEFFVPTEAGEVAGINRAEIALAIQEEDAAWIARHAKAESLCLPYAFEAGAPSVRENYLHPDKVVFGFLGSAHAFNIAGMTAYCDELAKIVGRTAAPVELKIAGRVSRAIPKEGPWILESYAADESRFLAGVDVAVVPVFDGTGFKVKVADCAAHGIPILAASHAAIGMQLDRRMIAGTPAELAEMTVEIAFRRPDYGALRRGAEKAHRNLLQRTGRAERRLVHALEHEQRTIVYDLTGLNLKQTTCVLLGWSGALQLMSHKAKQLVVAPDALREELKELGPAGVFFVGEADVQALRSPPARWITVANTGPARWGARAEDVVIDTFWAAALDHRPAEDAPAALAPETGAVFWHYVTWGWIARRLVELSLRDPAFPMLGDSVLVTDSRRRNLLKSRMGDLFGKLEIASIEDFPQFFDLLMHIASGRCANLAVGESRYPERTKILHDLCAAKGVPFLGPTPDGNLVEGKAPEALVKSLYARFEDQWRSVEGRKAA